MSRTTKTTQTWQDFCFIINLSAKLIISVINFCDDRGRQGNFSPLPCETTILVYEVARIFNAKPKANRERESKTRIKIDVCKWYRDTRNKQIILTKINNNNRIIKIKIAERGFDPRTRGLLTQQDASTAPLCCQLNMNSKNNKFF